MVCQGKEEGAERKLVENRQTAVKYYEGWEPGGGG